MADQKQKQRQDKGREQQTGKKGSQATGKQGKPKGDERRQEEQRKKSE